jgi:hypothetical protein
VPVLVGLDLHFQAFVVPQGSPYLTNAIAVRLL